MTFVLTATTTPNPTPALLLGVDAFNNPCGVTPPWASTNQFEIPMDFGSPTAALTTGLKRVWRAPFAGIYSSWNLIADAVGSVQVSLWRSANTSGSSHYPTIADLVSADGPMALSSQQFINSASFTDWTAGFFLAGDFLGFHVDTVDGVINKLWGGLVVVRQS